MTPLKFSAPWISLGDRRVMIWAGVLLFLALNVAIAVFRSLAPPMPSYDPKPHPVRKRVVAGIQDESLEESIDSLFDFENHDDVVVAMSNVRNMPASNTYLFTREFVGKLTRVRKILEEAAGKGDVIEGVIVPRLRVMLIASTDGYLDKMKAVALEYRDNPGISTNSSTAMASQYKARVEASVATYLLGEFQDFSSLPLLLEVFLDDRNLKHSPVPRVLVFAVMDKLTVEFPIERLDGESKLLLQVYLDMTAEMPRPVPAELPAWNADFDESDPRRTILGQPLPVEKQPKITLTVYPAALARYEHSMSGFIQPELGPFVEALAKFIQSAYPDYAPQLVSVSSPASTLDEPNTSE